MTRAQIQTTLSEFIEDFKSGKYKISCTDRPFGVKTEVKDSNSSFSLPVAILFYKDTGRYNEMMRAFFDSIKEEAKITNNTIPCGFVLDFCRVCCIYNEYYSAFQLLFYVAVKLAKKNKETYPKQSLSVVKSFVHDIKELYFAAQNDDHKSLLQLTRMFLNGDDDYFFIYDMEKNTKELQNIVKFCNEHNFKI